MPPIVNAGSRRANPAQSSKLAAKDNSSNANPRNSGPMDGKRDKHSEFMQLYRFDGSTGGNHGIQTGSQLLQDRELNNHSMVTNAYPDQSNDIDPTGTQSSGVERASRYGAGQSA